MFGAAVKSGENIWVIDYEIKKSVEDSATVATVIFNNRSMFKQLNEGNFVIRCVGDSFETNGDLQCFAKLPKVGVIAQPVAAGGIFSPGSFNKSDNHSIGVSAFIPPGASTGYRIGLADAGTDLLVGYTPAGGRSAGSQMILTNGRSIEGLIFSNYVRFTAIFFIGFLALLFIWLVTDFCRGFRRSPEPLPTPREFTIRIQIGERTHDVTQDI
jgi:hypothetical protein